MKFKPLLVLLLLFGSLLPTSVMAAEPTGYTYQVQTVYYSTSEITDYATYLDIDTTTLKTELPSEWQNQTKVYNADIDTDCYHYIEEINSTYYRVWFKTNFLSGNNHINFYIGGTENLGNANEVFQYYNDSITLSNVETKWSNDFETNASYIDDTYTYSRQLDGDTYVIYGLTVIAVDVSEISTDKGRLDFRWKTTQTGDEQIGIRYGYDGSVSAVLYSSSITADEYYNITVTWDSTGTYLFVNGVYENYFSTHPETGLEHLVFIGDYQYMDNISYSDLSGTTYADFKNLTTISSDSELLADVNLKNTYSKLAIISDTGDVISEFENQTNGTYSEISIDNLAIKNISDEVADTRPYWIEYDGSDYFAWIQTNGSETVTVEATGSYSPNISAVMEFGDEFTNDYSNWVNNGGVSILDGVLTISPSNHYVYTPNQYSTGEIHVKINSYSTNGGLIIGLGAGVWPASQSTQEVIDYGTPTGGYFGFWTGSTFSDTGVAIDLNEELIFKIEDGTIYQGETYVSAMTPVNPSTFWIYSSNGENTVDYVFVKKYQPTEPEISKNGNEYTIGESSVEDYQVALNVTGIATSTSDSLETAGGYGYGFETINETSVSLSTNTEYELSEILKENEIILNLNGNEVSANATGYGLLSLAGIDDIELSNIKVRKWVENPPTLSASTLPYLVGNDQDTEVTKTFSLYDEADISESFYNAITGTDLYSNFTVIFTGNAALEEYSLNSSNFTTNSIDLLVPSFGNVVISDSRGFVRKITYESDETEIDMVYPNKDQSLIEWYILLESASDVLTILDSRSNILYNATGSDTHSFYGIFGKNYIIQVNGETEATDTMSTAKSFDFRDDGYVYSNTTSGDIIDYNPPTIPTHPDFVLSGTVQNGTINITYEIDGAFSSLDLIVKTTNNTELYSQTLADAENTVLITGADNSSSYIAQATIHEVDGGINMYSYVITPEYPNAGLFSSAKIIFGETWSHILAILFIFVVLLSFSKVHMYAGTVAAVVTIVGLNFAGYLDFMSPITKAVVLLLAVLPSIIESR